ncbi:MAG: T9SS type A sorting domain-containing protein, partial [Bacteroidota bacterium]
IACTFAQTTTFNVWDRLGWRNAGLVALVQSEDYYFAVGAYSDQYQQRSATNPFVLKIDKSGEIVKRRFLHFPNTNIYFDNENVVLDRDQNIVIAGYSCNWSDPAGGCYPYLLKFDSQCDSLWYKTYPIYNRAWGGDNHPHVMVESDSGYVVGMRSPQSTVGIELRAYSYAGDMQRRVYIKKGNTNVDIHSLALTDSGTMIVGASMEDLSCPADQGRYKAYVFEADSNGNVLWEHTSSDQGSHFDTQGLYLTSDGGIVYACEQGRHEISPQGYDNYRFRPKLVKLNAQKKEEWAIALDTFAYCFELRDLVVTRGEGFVLLGSYCHIDFSRQGSFFQVYLAKVSSQGDSVWARSNAFEEESVNQYLYSGVEDSDGGLVFGGAADIRYVNIRRGISGSWWVKLDSMGCEVPGCELTISNEEGQDQLAQVQVYPNPASDRIYVNLPAALPYATSIELLTIEGQKSRETEFSPHSIHHSLDISGLAPGVYILRLRGSQQMFTQKVLIK